MTTKISSWLIRPRREWPLIGFLVGIAFGLLPGTTSCQTAARGAPTPVSTPIVSPSATPLVSSKPIPSGVYALFGVDDPKILTSPVWKMDYIPGIALRTRWESIQASPNSWNWNYIDSVITLCKSSGKQLSIRVVPGSDESPAWLYSAGATKFATTLERGKTSDWPAPWDQTFLQYWRAFVQAFGRRYDANPIVSYIQIEGPGGPGGEWYVCHSARDVPQFLAAGGTQAWERAAETIIGYYAYAFPTTPLLITTGNVTWPPNSQAMKDLVRAAFDAYDDRVGVMSNAIWKKPNPQSVGQALPAQYPTHPNGGQAFVAAHNPAVVAAELQTAKMLKLHFIELYWPDCVDPSNADAIGGFNQ